MRDQRPFFIADIARVRGPGIHTALDNGLFRFVPLIHNRL
jgi:hypothetical protein